MSCALSPTYILYVSTRIPLVMHRATIATESDARMFMGS